MNVWGKTKKFLTKRNFFISIGLFACLFFAFYIFLDAFYGSNYRSMQAPLFTFKEVNVTGLRDLHASGGTSVRFWDLRRRLSHVTGPKYIVDGMAEFHGYIKGIPTTFFGYQREDGPCFKHKVRRFIFTGTIESRPDLVTSEAEEAKRHGFEYVKVNVGSRFIETDENIDQIVDFIDHLPEESWVHFHCAHGKGRTSILLVMLDIMKNAPKVPLDDIVMRQHLLGSENLFNTTVWGNGTYDKKMLEARKKFIEDFYQFVCERRSGGISQWSEWRRLKGRR